MKELFKTSALLIFIVGIHFAYAQTSPTASVGIGPDATSSTETGTDNHTTVDMEPDAMSGTFSVVPAAGSSNTTNVDSKTNTTASVSQTIDSGRPGTTSIGDTGVSTTTIPGSPGVTTIPPGTSVRGSSVSTTPNPGPSPSVAPDTELKNSTRTKGPGTSLNSATGATQATTGALTGTTGLSTGTTGTR